MLAEHVATLIRVSSTLQEEDRVGPTIETACDLEAADLIDPDYPWGWICNVNFSGGTKEHP